MKNYIKKNQCRICKKRGLELILDLGKQPPANALIENVKIKENVFPLRLYWCKNCNLVQLLDIVDKKYLFSDYFYMTSASKPIVKHFIKYANYTFKKYLKNKKNSTVLEIGSNDGSLLKEFKKLGAKTIGIEPAKNLADLANHKGIKTINGFFSIKLAKKIAENQNISLIVANNVVGHIEDLYELMEGVKILIKNDGIFVFEVPYLIDFIKKREFDTVYHEHLSYFSLLPLMYLARKFGLEIFDVKKQRVHGGTIRIFISKKGNQKVSASVKKFEIHEKEFGINKKKTYVSFSNDVKKIKDEIRTILAKLKKQNYNIFGYGAPAKGNVLLNYCKIDTKFIDEIIDTTPIKQGKFTPGTHIPIVTPKKMYKKGLGDIALILAWNYSKDIINVEKKFQKKGGRFLIPIPKPTIK